MGVRGYDLLDKAAGRDIPALMLAAHALTKEDLKKSTERGAVLSKPAQQPVFLASQRER
jgi:hypothetical protein